MDLDDITHHPELVALALQDLCLLEQARAVHAGPGPGLIEDACRREREAAPCAGGTGGPSFGRGSCGAALLPPLRRAGPLRRPSNDGGLEREIERGETFIRVSERHGGARRAWARFRPRLRQLLALGVLPDDIAAHLFLAARFAQCAQRVCRLRTWLDR